MTRNYIHTILLIALVAMGVPYSVWAQTEPKNKPDLQTTNDGFFDPTREEKKPREAYQFGMEYRVEAGYVQNDMRAISDTTRMTFLHGARMGATFTFLLPIHFSLQTGLLYQLSYGTSAQHYPTMQAETAQIEYVQHRLVDHTFTVPLRVYYTIPLWKKLNMVFYTGPQLQIGVSQNDYMALHLSEATNEWLMGQGILPTRADGTLDYGHDQYSDVLGRANIQYGLGGGFEWDCYRLDAGYDFGLNNIRRNARTKNDNLWGWQWHVSFSYRF